MDADERVEVGGVVDGESDFPDSMEDRLGRTRKMINKKEVRKSRRLKSFKCISSST